MEPPLDVMVVDDEPPAVHDLAALLHKDPRIGRIHTAGSGAEALVVLQEQHIDAIFLDIHMPALTGLDIARTIGRFAAPVPVVFVTADEAHAVEAFELKAADYLLKPVEEARLFETVGRLCGLGTAGPTAGPGGGPGGGAGGAGGGAEDPERTRIAVARGEVSLLISRDEVLYAEAVRDYVRLHTANGSYLVRVPLSELARQWATAGFVRVHRSYLVPLQRVWSAKLGETRGTVMVGGAELPVSRRNLPLVREMLAKSRVRSRR